MGILDGVLTGFVLSPIPPGQPGDFDLDGDVDGADFLVWQRGESPDPMSESDRELWQTNFPSVSFMPASLAIPESISLPLVILAVILARTQFRRESVNRRIVEGHRRCSTMNQRLSPSPWLGAALAIGLSVVGMANADGTKLDDNPRSLCRIEIIDKQSGWPVPLVELVTTHGVRFISDNAGRIAFDLPELMGQETWFSVASPGYEVPADGFGIRGVRLEPKPGKTVRIEVERTSIAKRLGRLTGAGLFAESQKLGLELGWEESGVLGCDSVQNAVHGGKLFWAWGDTAVAQYPMGIFHVTSATTPVAPLSSLAPPLRIKLDYFTDSNGRPRGVAKMPGEGPTWVSGYISLPDKTGISRLVGTYSKIRPPMEAYECGLCVWNDDTEEFEHLRTIWTMSRETPTCPPVPDGHPLIVAEQGADQLLFGNPLPTLRCPATFEAWQDPSQWEVLQPQKHFVSASDGPDVHPHSGSIAWNAYRQKWVAVFMETFGKPSAFGEIWYAEAAAPTGPWGPAVKILSHHNYTFYNPRIHPELTPHESPVLIFEGTYTRAFANQPEPTPRYDYNQILYRLDLDDPQLTRAHVSESHN